MFGLFKSTHVNARAVIKAMPLVQLAPRITPTVIDKPNNLDFIHQNLLQSLEGELTETVKDEMAIILLGHLTPDDIFELLTMVKNKELVRRIVRQYPHSLD